ncbi:MAG: response regulator, partial [Clostridia bacterium]|nr:response regulator [Clostridia bacterium]
MPRSFHILICDDDPVVHESLGLYLDAENFTHVSAFDGIAALERIESDHPDLVVLDLMMPRMNGADVCREIRRTSK